MRTTIEHEPNAAGFPFPDQVPGYVQDAIAAEELLLQFRRETRDGINSSSLELISSSAQEITRAAMLRFLSGGKIAEEQAEKRFERAEWEDNVAALEQYNNFIYSCANSGLCQMNVDGVRQFFRDQQYPLLATHSDKESVVEFSGKPIFGFGYEELRHSSNSGLRQRDDKKIIPVAYSKAGIKRSGVDSKIPNVSRYPSGYSVERQEVHAGQLHGLEKLEKVNGKYQVGSLSVALALSLHVDPRAIDIDVDNVKNSDRLRIITARGADVLLLSTERKPEHRTFEVSSVVVAMRAAYNLSRRARSGSRLPEAFPLHLAIELSYSRNYDRDAPANKPDGFRMLAELAAEIAEAEGSDPMEYMQAFHRILAK